VAKAGDGHTLGIGFNGPIAFAPFLYRKMPYDPAKDLLPVVMTTSQPNVLAVNADKVPAKTVAEFVTWAKAQGGKANYSSLGNGSSAHLTMELFLAETGVKATHIPFNGSPPAAMAVAQGEADATFMVAPALLPHVKNNKVRLLAVSSNERPESLKDVPTLAASGYPNVESLAWNGLFASPGTPDAVVARINADVNEVLKDAAVKSTLDAQGLTTVGGSAADFKRVIDGDVKRWGPVIDKLGLKLD
jgi:tripartite-type tricarboxylate transporter receptor subunit TctC